MANKLALTDEARKVLVAALADAMPITTACDLAGIGRTTFYGYIQRGTQGEEPYATLVRDLRKARAGGIQTLLGRAHTQSLEDPSQVRYLLGVYDSRSFGREPETQDFVQEALGSLDHEGQVELMAGMPEVRAAVLASITDEERAGMAPIMLTQGDDDDG